MVMSASMYRCVGADRQLSTQPSRSAAPANATGAGRKRNGRSQRLNSLSRRRCMVAQSGSWNSSGKEIRDRRTQVARRNRPLFRLSHAVSVDFEVERDDRDVIAAATLLDRQDPTFTLAPHIHEAPSWDPGLHDIGRVEEATRPRQGTEPLADLGRHGGRQVVEGCPACNAALWKGVCSNGQDDRKGCNERDSESSCRHRPCLPRALTRRATRYSARANQIKTVSAMKGSVTSISHPLTAKL